MKIWDRKEVPKRWMMYGMREAWHPVAFYEAARRSQIRKDDKRKLPRLLIDGYDNLVCGNFVTRTDVYLLVHLEERLRVEDIRRRAGDAYAPGQSGGLHELVRKSSGSPEIVVEVCLRYGPTAALYGDLHADLRRYELITAGLLKGLAEAAFHERTSTARAEEAAWFTGSLPEKQRKDLISKWRKGGGDGHPWHWASLETMATMTSDENSSRIPHLGDEDRRSWHQSLVRVKRVRNALSHPVKGHVLAEEDIETVKTALLDVTRLTARCVAKGNATTTALPAREDLHLSELLRSRLDGDASALNLDGAWPEHAAKGGYAIEDARRDFARWKGTGS